MNKEYFLEVAPHYLVMIAILFAVLTALEAFLGGVDFWVGLGIAIVIGIAYRPVVKLLGVAPKVWQ